MWSAAALSPASMGDEPSLSAGAVDSADAEQAYLAILGERVREARARRGTTRKTLARDSGVSERYIAQLESGQGNMSILLLRQIASALDTPLESLVMETAEPPELAHAIALLRGLPDAQAARACRLLVTQLSGEPLDNRHARIALIGPKGAGKSTLGAMLAE